VSVATYAAAQLLRVLPRVRISRAVGRLCERKLPERVSRALAQAYCRAYAVDMADVEPLPFAYPTFDAFFTRALREGARLVSDDVLVSPADGVMSAAGPIGLGSQLTIKSRPYSLGELLGDRDEALRYIGGSFFVVYLSPRDYHRVHSPVDGRIGFVRGIEGDLFPVNAIGERHVPRLFVRNNRVVIYVETEELGRVAVVMVGAMIVGRISVSSFNGDAALLGPRRIDPPISVRKGDEIGIFHLGSTVVVLLGPGIEVKRAIGSVRYGESLMRAS
jgi:phosphatidylserine decarboxylase